VKVDDKRVIIKQGYQKGKTVQNMHDIPPTESIDEKETEETNDKHKETLKATIRSTINRRKQSEERQEKHNRKR
jgi:flagellar biogenesis protein FliO